MKIQFLLFVALGIFGFISLSAQTAPPKAIKPMEAISADYQSLLRNSGYEAFPFDISTLSDGQYGITLKVQEYQHGKKINDDILLGALLFPNMRLLSEFPEEARQTVKQEEMADPQRGIYTLARKIMIGFTPVVTDSIRPMVLDVENSISAALQLRMLPQYENNDSVNGKEIYNYGTRPFKVREFAADEFIPLVLFGSWWYDKDFNIHRFCGEKKIEPDMSSEILKYIPHYYIIGIEVRPIKMLE